MSTMRQVLIYPDNEDGGWVCDVPSLPGCVSQGETKEEALRNVRDAIDSWIEAAKSLGRDVPGDSQDVEISLV